MATTTPPASNPLPTYDPIAAGRSDARPAWQPLAVRGALIAVGAAGVVGLILLVWRAAAPGGDPAPEGDILDVAKFVSTPKFEQLAEPQKRPYMARLRQDQEQVKQAFVKGDLTEQQFQAADFNIWLERQFDRMEDYYDLPKSKRQAFLDELVEKKIAKKKASAAGAADAGTQVSVKFDHEDSEMMESRKDRWPADMKEQWKQYQNALEDRERAKGV